MHGKLIRLSMAKKKKKKLVVNSNDVFFDRKMKDFLFVGIYLHFRLN